MRALHARNAAIVLGPGLNRPVHAAVCFTPRGETVGGTGMGIRMADRAGVPVLNLAVQSPREVCVFLRNLRLSAQSGGSAGRVPLAEGEGV